MSSFNWMFVFVTSGCAEQTHSATMQTPAGAMHVVGVSSHDAACAAAARAAAAGEVDFIELCGDFGPEGCEQVLEAIDHRVPVGYVTYFPDEMEKLLRVVG